MIDLIISTMAMLAPPVALVCVIDDWFIRPGRQLVLKDGQPTPDPLVMRLLYGVLPLLVIAVFFELMSAQRADFSLVLIIITGVSGVVWGIDHWLLSPRRLAAARAAGREPDSLQIPGTVDYARSFFPVMAVLLVLRSFLYEPYSIPSDSMMPTLLDGD